MRTRTDCPRRWPHHRWLRAVKEEEASFDAPDRCIINFRHRGHFERATRDVSRAVCRVFTHPYHTPQTVKEAPLFTFRLFDVIHNSHNVTAEEKAAVFPSKSGRSVGILGHSRVAPEMAAMASQPNEFAVVDLWIRGTLMAAFRQRVRDGQPEKTKTTAALIQTPSGHWRELLDMAIGRCTRPWRAMFFSL